MGKFEVYKKSEFSESYKCVSPYDSGFVEIRFTVHYNTEEVSFCSTSLKYDNEFFLEAIRFARALITNYKLEV